MGMDLMMELIPMRFSKCSSVEEWEEWVAWAAITTLIWEVTEVDNSSHIGLIDGKKLILLSD